MKILCDRAKLLAGFATASPFAPSRSPKPILQNIRLDVRKDLVSLTATDMEMGVRVNVEGVNVDKEGSAILPNANFSAILHETSDEKLQIETTAKGIVVKGARSEFKRLKDAQEKRRKRATIDELDRDLQDLLAFYRDVLVVQFNGEVTLVNAEQLPNLEKIAQRGSPETTMQAMQAILEAREKITAYVTPLLAVEEMVLTLRAS